MASGFIRDLLPERIQFPIADQYTFAEFVTWHVNIMSKALQVSV